tara:strand:+ start:527 stop:820 length:294 start_codon:yes stop_codon:yes gene_type:complete
MFKNIIIVVLVVIILNLLVQNKENINILVKDLADTKEMVVDGTNYVSKAFEKEFSVQEFNVDIDIPPLHIKKEPFSEGSGIKEPMIREETFFNEEEK